MQKSRGIIYISFSLSPSNWASNRRLLPSYPISPKSSNFHHLPSYSSPLDIYLHTIYPPFFMPSSWSPSLHHPTFVLVGILTSHILLTDQTILNCFSSSPFKLFYPTLCSIRRDVWSVTGSTLHTLLDGLSHPTQHIIQGRKLNNTSWGNEIFDVTVFVFVKIETIFLK